ncbi:MAG: hypothetical protein ACFFD4_09815 [Candidatus Odinarchaeota archaeon]
MNEKRTRNQKKDGGLNRGKRGNRTSREKTSPPSRGKDSRKTAGKNRDRQTAAGVNKVETVNQDSWGLVKQFP